VAGCARPRPLVRRSVSRLRPAYAPALVIASAGKVYCRKRPTISPSRAGA